ncbi:MAG: hypothetical protein UR28_C0026G0010 [Candidatus Peregrinibacteria bacterium GW2011_GWF2_33_10]|nr:MAG: hypothetical protein UR28_C0026G0010 [Candidatus Peregrinibacteria bacterium GW2011_GWF2_33_10]OGJ44266.1 MAG: hypothetical protein A2263_05415 [Candidatus Peregrinibacteria bacterium RIFOXYA2_FULL_33_21]OGJ45105.1 MAG: hypothetical protein A2272_06020 [Candidatus Peregrinibacteria bacterium RIFOXYA12_FULL_33_12]OGJ50087.1 MAG: hypothetical protein A2307_01825 [Candidatus Peregrinibacteria bacterium RIFOXYB2_FULL_33_20]
MLKINLTLFNQRFIFENEVLNADDKFSATPQINVDEGPSDVFKDRQQKNQAAMQKAKKDEASFKKQETPDKWVRIVIYLVFKVDIGGEGTIEEAIASLTPEQKASVDSYVAQLEKLAKEKEERDRIVEEEKQKKLADQQKQAEA